MRPAVPPISQISTDRAGCWRHGSPLEDYGRLLLAGERTVEIAHEALITQWPWLQNTLNEAAADMRVLDRLMDKARRWNRPGPAVPSISPLGPN